jgi:hypothetical protein
MHFFQLERFIRMVSLGQFSLSGITGSGANLAPGLGEVIRLAFVQAFDEPPSRPL